MIIGIFLSGGTETRTGVSTPKQYLPLAEKPLALHGFEILKSFHLIAKVIVVCEKKYQPLFGNVLFANPGKRRQDSLYNALQCLDPSCETVVIHDAVRPLLTEDDLEKVLHTGMQYGAAALATPVKEIIKRANEENMVLETLYRPSLFQVQTPQVLKKEILLKGFEKALLEDITVPDDISLAELINYPAKLIMGSSENIKIDTPEDLTFAENVFRERIPVY